MKTNGNEAAFATADSRTEGTTTWQGQKGLSKREFLAAMAMQGICGDGIPGSRHFPKETAMEAVQYADALIEALNK